MATETRVRSIEELRELVAATNDKRERLDRVLELARALGKSRPAEAIDVARKGARTARAMREYKLATMLMITQSEAEIDSGNAEGAIATLETALSLANELGDEMLIVVCQHGIGIALSNIGEHARAFAIMSLALETAIDAGLSEREGAIRNSLGILHTDTGDYARAFDEFGRCHELFTALGHPGGCWAMNNIGSLYLSLNDLERAHEHFRRFIECRGADVDPIERIGSEINLGTVMVRRGSYSDGMLHLERALDMAREIGSARSAMITLGTIGDAQRDVGDLDAAVESWSEALRISRAIGEREWSVLAGLAGVHRSAGRHSDAVPMALEALESARSHGDRGSEARVLALLADCYEAIGDGAEAYRYHKQLVALREELLGLEKQREIAAIEMRAQIERAERERQELVRRNRELEEEMVRKKSELSALALSLIEKGCFLDSMKTELESTLGDMEITSRPAIRGIVRKVEQGAGVRENWRVFEAQFEQVHRGFLGRLLEAHPDLTRTELKIAALLKANMTSKEIAELLASSARTIDNHRSHIRRKLGLPDDVNLTKFLATYAPENRNTVRDS